MADDSDLQARKTPAVPLGFDTAQDFLKEMMQRYDRSVSADEHNREAAVQDIEFTYGEQWDTVVRAQREKRNKPVITVNRLPAFVSQIVNNRLLNETEIRVLPDRDGSKEVATIRQGLIKSIFKNSESDYARDEAMKYQTICGMGAFHLCLEYANNDVFEQDIKIKPIADPFSVVFDEMSVEPSGADANYAFVTDDIPNDVFKARYPKASMTPFPDIMPNGSEEWFSQEAVRVVSYWRMVEQGKKVLVLLVDGTTHELTPADNIETMLAMGLVAKHKDGRPYVREVPRRFAQMYLCSGADILEGPYDLPISSIPVFRVPGWELRRGTKVYRWGLVRFLKDPQRLHNYQRSLAAEAMVAAPRNKWVATKDAVSGYEKEWRNSHISDDPLLLYNAEGTKPERVAPPPVDPQLLTEMNLTVQDFKDVSNIHEAALGQKSNEVSGKAIQQRQQMTDLASYIYHDRLRIAETRCAVICNELIPTVYDTTRITTIMGADDKEVQMVLNDPMDPMTDVTAGKYSVTVSTGPSTITKRALAAEQMTAFVNAAPTVAPLVMDLVAEAQDWPKAQEFARRFRMQLPPGAVSQDEIPPEMLQMQQEQQQEAQIRKDIEAKQALAEIANLEAQAAERLARAENLRAQAQQSLSDAKARADDVEGKNLERDIDARFRVIEAALASQPKEETETDDD
jgi:hypothetical protein